MIVAMMVKRVGQDDDQAWEENFVVEETGCLRMGNSRRGYGLMKDPNESAEFYAKKVVQYFNDTLRPGETERVVVSVKQVL